MTATAPASILGGPIAPALKNATGNANAAAGDFQSFLTLLTAQMRNQDPLSPLDATEFVAQLASFSTVEQIIGTNNRLDGLIARTTAQSLTSIASWIGRDAATTDGSFRATGENVQFVVPKTRAGESVEAIIRTPQGNVLRRLAVTGDANGLAEWNGRDASGRILSPQDLILEFAISADGKAARTEPGEVLTRITGVNGGAGGATLMLADGRTVAPEALSRVQQARTG